MLAKPCSERLEESTHSIYCGHKVAAHPLPAPKFMHQL